MDDTIFNSSMATNGTLTQAQIVTTAVIGSILITLVMLNIVLYSIYKKLMQDPKPTIKLGKQESIQLYQMKSTMEYNTLSNSSMNQSQSRTLESTSYSGEETMSVNISSADVTKSFSHDRSMCSSSVNESLALETSMELQVSNSVNIKPWKERKQSLSKIVKESASERIDRESTDSLEIEAQIHDNSLQNTNKPQRLSDIHLYHCIKSQMAQNEIQRSITHTKQSKPVPGSAREIPLEENCLQEQSTFKQNEKKSKELQMNNHLSQKSEIPQRSEGADNPDDKSLRLKNSDRENITKGLSESLSRHQKPPRNSRERVHSKCSKESYDSPISKEHDHSKPLKGIDHSTNPRERNDSRVSRERSHLIQSSEYPQTSTSREQVKSKCLKENLHSRSSKEHVHSKISRDHTRPHSFRIQNEIKGYVDMTDFENDSDTEASVLAALDSVQTYQGVQLLTSGEGLMGCPVVEFQNKAFEFSETKTSLEEVDDTDL